MDHFATPSDNDLENVRKLLLEQAYSAKTKRPSHKESLKKSLAHWSPHNAGVSFETMATLLNQAGLELKPDTVRRYYWTLRKELELTVEAKKHAAMLANFDNKVHKRIAAEGLRESMPKMSTRVSTTRSVESTSGTAPLKSKPDSDIKSRVAKIPIVAAAPQMITADRKTDNLMTVKTEKQPFMVLSR